MSTTRYKIRLWEYDGEASVANAVTFDSFAEAEARFNDLRVSEKRNSTTRTQRKAWWRTNE